MKTQLLSNAFNQYKLVRCISGLLFLIFYSSLYSQDTIVKKDKHIVPAQLIEVGTTEIRYKLPNYPQGPDFIIRKYEVEKIILGNGTEMKIETTKEDIQEQTKHYEVARAFKIHPFSLFNEHFALGYEEMIKPGFNWETKIGFIGPDISPLLDFNSKGGFVKIGIKLLKLRSKKTNESLYENPLNGKYIKTELSYSSFEGLGYYYIHPNTPTTILTNLKTKYNAFALNFIFGKQYLFGQRLTFDCYGGMGFGYSFQRLYSTKVSYYIDEVPRSNFYSHFFISNYVPISFTAGVSFGIITKSNR